MENVKDPPGDHSSEDENIPQQSPAQEASPITTQPTAENQVLASDPRLSASEDYSVANRRRAHRGRRRSLDNMHAMTARNRSDVRQMQQAPNESQITETRGRRSKSGAPAVRLDMNLELDVELKARINGDITLSILGGEQDRR
ncbi:hypothetical protein ACRALDRAFT_1060029 [Sodiomyces alcalophilus JCM 7366]|uniref:uncharacterized protein n=1 Tax=Sodiomyces alcalophilus JCM 7366 TaxID=591952 RepID=UPI0039B607B3